MENKNKIFCKKCSTEFQPIVKKSFLGFQLIKCPNCNKKITLPLTNGYRIIYWLILVISMPLGFIKVLSDRDIPMPGLLGIATIVALLKDYKLKKNIKLIDDRKN